MRTRKQRMRVNEVHFILVLVCVCVCGMTPDAVEAKKFKLTHVGREDLDARAVETMLSKPHREHERRRFLKEEDTQYLYSVSNATDFHEQMVDETKDQHVIATSKLSGSVMKTGYYAMELLLGTPPQAFQVIVDTGSTIAYVPCKFCGDKCGVHLSKPFDPQLSGTASFINCLSVHCATFCGSRRCNCRSSLEFLGDVRLPMMNVCAYSRRYQEQSSSKGLLLTDILSLNNIGNYRFGFGCETEETGAIYNQNADGVVGFGNNPSSIINQLVLQDAIANSFSLCVGGFGGGGAIFLGDDSVPAAENMQYAAMQEDPRHPEFYSVKMESIQLGTNVLNVSPQTYQQGYGAVVDSGTTFLYLPEQAYLNFNQLLKAELAKHKDKIMRVPSPDPRYPDDLCYSSTSSFLNRLFHQSERERQQRETRTYQEKDELLTLFPNITMEMAGAEGGTIKLSFPPSNYLFGIAHRGSHGFCVGVYNNHDSGVLLGSVLMRNALVSFDLGKRRIGFAPGYDCDQM